MKIRTTAAAAALGLVFAGAALAQSGTIQRDANQQQRIEARALRDGKLTAAEKARLAREQNRVSRDIYREKHDAQTGNPNSASSQRMQADVQRNVNQQE